MYIIWCWCHNFILLLMHLQKIHSGLSLSYWTQVVILDLICPLFCVIFLVLNLICHCGLALPFWVDFVILTWIPSFGLETHFVILGSFGHSGMSPLLWDDFDILGWISHPETNLSFWDEFFVLGWILKFVLN